MRGTGLGTPSVVERESDQVLKGVGVNWNVVVFQVFAHIPFMDVVAIGGLIEQLLKQLWIGHTNRFDE